MLHLTPKEYCPIVMPEKSPWQVSQDDFLCVEKYTKRCSSVSHFSKLRSGTTYIAACGLKSGAHTSGVTFTTPVKKPAIQYYKHQEFNGLGGRRLADGRRKLYIKDTGNVIKQLQLETFSMLSSLHQSQYLDGAIMGTAYKHNLVQVRFLPSDLREYEIVAGNVIKGIEVKIGSGKAPSQNYKDFRVSFKYISETEEWTREESNTDPISGSVELQRRSSTKCDKFFFAV